MHEITLTPDATVGILLAHRARQPKGIDEFRASLDTEAWLLGPRDALVEVVTEEVDIRKPDGTIERGQRSTIRASAPEARTVRCEDHILKHIKAALAAALDDGKTFGFTPGAGTIKMGLEAHDALEKAAKVEVEKAVPRVLDGNKAKKVAGA